MARTLALIALRLGLCAAAIWPLWWWLGPAGLALGAPLFGIALARPLLDLFSQARAAVRERAYASVEGRYYAYKDVPIDVIEGDDGHRWLRLADVRKVVVGLAGDAVLAKAHPNSLIQDGLPPATYLRDDALLAQLARATAPATLKFRLWVERDIAFPARRRRGEPAEPGHAGSPVEPRLARGSGPDSAA